VEILDPGHLYALRSLDNGPERRLRFAKRIGERYPGNTGEPYAGTNCQEVIRALIDRMRYLNGQIPCVETETAIGLLQAALVLFEVRAKRVKGKTLDMPTIATLEAACPCRKCGHVDCECEFAGQPWRAE
jgi:hypothetical protein